MSFAEDMRTLGECQATLVQSEKDLKATRAALRLLIAALEAHTDTGVALTMAHLALHQYEEANAA